MFTLYNLDEGSQVKVPLLDGVLERALKLMDEWLAKKPELEAAPSYLLLFNAMTCIDLVRTIHAFQNAGLDEELALRFAHSRLPQVFMYAGVTALLGINTWWLDNKIAMLTDPPNAFGLTRDDATGSERFKKREDWDELHNSAEFNVELTNLVGPEATELLFKACQAYDKWARETDKKGEAEVGRPKQMETEVSYEKKLEAETGLSKQMAVEVAHEMQPAAEARLPKQMAAEIAHARKLLAEIGLVMRSEVGVPPAKKEMAGVGLPEQLEVDQEKKPEVGIGSKTIENNHERANS